MQDRIIGSVVAFNPNWDLLRQTISSFLKAAPDATVIVWDNSLTSAVKEQIASEFAGKKVIYEKSPGNLGYGTGNNKVFALYGKDAEYFCILNPDLMIPEESITGLVEYLKAHPDVGLASGSIYGMDNSYHDVHKLMPSFFKFLYNFLSQKLKFLPKLKMLSYKDMKNPFKTPIISGCFMFYRSSHYQELNGFDERFFLYFEDFDISLRSFLMNKSVIVPSVKIFHNWKRESHKSAKVFKIHLKSAFSFYGKWGFGFTTSNKVNKETLKALS